MKKEIMTRNKKALILLPSLEKGDGSAAAIMNYYDALAEDGWKVDFLLVRGTQNNRTEKITQNNGQIFVLPQKNKYSYTVTKNDYDSYKKRKLFCSSRKSSGPYRILCAEKR